MMPSRSQGFAGRIATCSARRWLTGALLLCTLLISTRMQCSLGTALSNPTTSDYSDHQEDRGARASVAGGQVSGDIVAIKEGADLDLSCPIVVPDEDMIISWTCENEPANIRSSRVHVTDSGKLRIYSAKLGDSCNYRCEAANGFGTLSVVIKVIIVERRLLDQLTKRTGARNSTAATNVERGHRQLQSRIVSTGIPMMSKSAAPVGPDQDDPEPNRSIPTDNGETDIEIQIQPSRVYINKNSTFNLECRIRYAPHLVVPQIIWLKEFMGPKPDSLPEALERNLLLLDDVYYHSLNWPRSVTYSDKSLTASSALLIRQSNYVHSGRYVCLAGYPTALMNLQLNKANPSTEIEPLSSASEHVRSALKYKMTHALVEVDDPEGKLKHKLSLNRLAGGKRPEQSNLLLDVVSSNSWVRNLTILLCLLCSAFTLYKLLQLRRKTSKTTPSSPLSDSNLTGSAHVRVGEGLCGGGLVGANEDAPDLRVSSNKVAKNDYKIDEKLLGAKLMTLGDGEVDLSTDHVYSEIGYNSNKALFSASEPYYKQPRLNLSKSANDG